MSWGLQYKLSVFAHGQMLIMSTAMILFTAAACLTNLICPNYIGLSALLSDFWLFVHLSVHFSDCRPRPPSTAMSWSITRAAPGLPLPLEFALNLVCMPRPSVTCFLLHTLLARELTSPIVTATL